MPPSEVSADWGAQRIKGMSLFKAVWEPLRSRLAGGAPQPGQAGDEPHRGVPVPQARPGMMWETCRDLVEKAGVEVLLREPGDGRRAAAPAGAVAVVFEHEGRPPPGRDRPRHQLHALLGAGAGHGPARPRPRCAAAADALQYRDFLTVALVVPEASGFPDNWIYIHSPKVKVGRIQNFGAWSPFMVRDGTTCLGMEYFVFEGDELWERRRRRPRGAGHRPSSPPSAWSSRPQVQRGYVVRMPKAYPVYDDTYRAAVDTMRHWLAAEVPNVHPVGRNGMHKYNNQDHSMYTAMLTVENIVAGTGHDIWSVNVDEEYHEETPGARRPRRGRAATRRSSPDGWPPSRVAARRSGPGRRGRSRPAPGEACPACGACRRGRRRSATPSPWRSPPPSSAWSASSRRCSWPTCSPPRATAP